MGRLIDSDAFATRIMQVWDKAEKKGRQDIVRVLADIVTPCLVGTPTAYDVDKVIKKLNSRSFFMDVSSDEDGCWNDDDYEVVHLDTAIEIVKGGGLDAS